MAAAFMSVGPLIHAIHAVSMVGGIVIAHHRCRIVASVIVRAIDIRARIPIAGVIGRMAVGSMVPDSKPETEAEKEAPAGFRGQRRSQNHNKRKSGDDESLPHRAPPEDTYTIRWH
jgi:hypothetical protein